MSAIQLLKQAVSKLETASTSDDGQTQISTMTAAALPSPPHSEGMPKYQSQVVDTFLRSPGNEVAFLPTGLGQCTVVDSIARTMLERHPRKHIVVCVVRPAQALSHAERLRTSLGVPVNAFCGGDFLYDFPKEFANNKVLVFTAGLLMRLTKLGIYRLDSASLLVLHDAFSAVRNHPMNTLVREYYWKMDHTATTAAAAHSTKQEREPSSPFANAPADGASNTIYDRPKLLAVVLPQLQNLQRPFDKLRQLVRKLSHSAQAGVVLPTGPALEALAARVHRARMALHGYVPAEVEQELLEALQAHCLLVWDTLHEFGLNHFGRLIHFPPNVAPQQSAATPGGGGGGGGGGGRQTQQFSQQQHHQQQDNNNNGGSRMNSGIGSEAVFALDPAHHDWHQVELMVRHSITSTEALSITDPEHPRSAAAIAVMEHVLQLCGAVRRGMELGAAAGLGPALPALKSLLEFLETTSAAGAAFATTAAVEVEGSPGIGESSPSASPSTAASVDAKLTSRLLDVLGSSPLLRWMNTQPDLGSLLGSKEPCSRLNALLIALQEVTDHAAACDRFPQPRRVALVVGEEASVESVERALRHNSTAPSSFLVPPTHNFTAAVSRWTPPPSSDADAGPAVISETIEAFPSADIDLNTTIDDTTTSSGSGSGSSAKTRAQLRVSILTADEAMSASGTALISSADEVMWYSASDILHAAGFDYESPALTTLYQACAVGLDPGPTCHVIATEAQAAAWLEVRRADQLLFAALQLVAAGDASFEEYLGQLMAGGVGANQLDYAVPPPSEVLHMLCLGLCGQPPRFDLNKVQGERQPKQQATATLPFEIVAAAETFSLYGRESIEAPLWGDPAESEAEARDSAAEQALAALGALGMAAAYWQTRQLLLCSKQMSHMAASAATAAAIPLRQLTISSYGAVAGGPMPPSPFVDASTTTVKNKTGSPGMTAHQGYVDPHAVVPPERLICHVCGIVTTSEAHLAEHMAGRRHQKNLERLQQQGMAQMPASISPFNRAGSSGSNSSGSRSEDGGEKGHHERSKLGAREGGAKDGGGGATSQTLLLSSSSSLQLATLNTIDRLPSTLSDVFLRRSSSLHRNPSGNVYEGFPCVRVGELVLPSSMDLSAYMEELQKMGELESTTGSEPLPPIKENEGGSPAGGSSIKSGGGGGGGDGGYGGSTRGSNSPAPKARGAGGGGGGGGPRNGNSGYSSGFRNGGGGNGSSSRIGGGLGGGGGGQQQWGMAGSQMPYQAYQQYQQYPSAYRQQQQQQQQSYRQQGIPPQAGQLRSPQRGGAGGYRQQQQQHPLDSALGPLPGVGGGGIHPYSGVPQPVHGHNGAGIHHMGGYPQQQHHMGMQYHMPYHMQASGSIQAQQQHHQQQQQHFLSAVQSYQAGHQGVMTGGMHAGGMQMPAVSGGMQQQQQQQHLQQQRGYGGQAYYLQQQQPQQGGHPGSQQHMGQQPHFGWPAPRGPRQQQ